MPALYEFVRVSVQYLPKLNQWYVIPYEKKGTFLNSVEECVKSNDWESFHLWWGIYKVEGEVELFTRKKK